MRAVVAYVRRVMQLLALAAAVAATAIGAVLPSYFGAHFAAQATSVMLGTASSSGTPVTALMSALGFVAASCSVAMLKERDGCDGTVVRDGMVVATLDAGDACESTRDDVLATLTVVGWVHVCVLTYCLVFRAKMCIDEVAKRQLKMPWIAFVVDASASYIDAADFTFMLITALAVRNVVGIGVTPIQTAPLLLLALLKGVISVLRRYNAVLHAFCTLLTFVSATALALWPPFTCDEHFNTLATAYVERCDDERHVLRALTLVMAALMLVACVPAHVRTACWQRCSALCRPRCRRRRGGGRRWFGVCVLVRGAMGGVLVAVKTAAWSYESQMYLGTVALYGAYGFYIRYATRATTTLCGGDAWFHRQRLLHCAFYVAAGVLLWSEEPQAAGAVLLSDTAVGLAFFWWHHRGH